MLEAEFNSRIYMLCYWAVSIHRTGEYRVYSVRTILDIWKNFAISEDEKFQRQKSIQNSLMEFLDTYPLGGNGICEREGINHIYFTNFLNLLRKNKNILNYNDSDRIRNYISSFW